MNSKETNIELICKMSTLLSVMSDTTRLKILFSLLNEEKCTCACGCGGDCSCSKCNELHCMIEKSVNEIVNDTGCSQSLISHQLKILRDNELVKTRKEGLKVYYSLKDGHIKELLNIAKEHVEEE